MDLYKLYKLHKLYWIFSFPYAKIMHYMKKMDIALLGCGLLGSNIVNLWKNNPYFKESFNIKKILVRDLSKSRHTSLEGFLVTNDPQELIRDTAIKAVIDATGAQDDIIELIKDLILNQKSIVSTNIFFVQKYYPILKNLVDRKKVFYRFSPALGFNISILEEKIRSDSIEELIGVLDEISNKLILEIEKGAIDLAKAKAILEKLNINHLMVEKAIMGVHAISKLALLINLITGKCNKDNIYSNSLSNINIADINFANEVGYKIKQIAYFENKGNYYRAFVSAVLIDKSYILSSIKNDEVGLYIKYKNIGETCLVNSISSLLLANLAFLDLFKIKEGLGNGELTYPTPVIEFKDETKFDFNYYIRALFVNKPDSIVNIIGLLRDNNIQIKDVRIGKAGEENHLNIFIITHLINEDKATQLIKGLTHFEFVKEAIKLRILGN